MRDAKGLNYIARLLAEPGRELFVLDVAGGSAAKADYKERLQDLKSELAEAEQANDSGRASRLRHEIETLTHRVSAALGVGSSGRDGAERARKAVSGRITETIGRIRLEHPELALHLTNAIRLGSYCEYQPEKSTTWDW